MFDKRLKNLLTLSILSLQLSLSGVVSAQQIDNAQMATLGISLSDDQRMETINILGANDVSKTAILNIDGDTVNEYLKDGSNSSTNIYSSAYIETKPEGYGVQVQILTPENISLISESTYQSAAITAGAKNVLIKIASVVPVSGEGALTGLYKSFEEAGFSLDESAIYTAEQQLILEKKLVEITHLSADEVSAIVNQLNLLIIDAVQKNEEVNEILARTLVNEVIEGLKSNISEDALILLVEHAISYATSPAALDESTRKTIETSTTKTIVGEELTNGNINVVIDDIYFDEKDPYMEIEADNIVTVEYTLTNNGGENYYTGDDFQLYVNNHKAERYYTTTDKTGQVSPGRTISVKSSFGFNGEISNIELELKDTFNWEGEATIIPVDYIRSNIEADLESDENNINSSTDDNSGEYIDSENEVDILYNSLTLTDKGEEYLEEPGDYSISDYSGRITLLKISHPEVTVELAQNVEVTIHTIKYIDIRDIPEEFKKDVEAELGVSRDGGQYIQYEYSVVNNNNFKIMNTYFESLVYSNGEQVNDNTLSLTEPFELNANAKVSNAFAASGAPRIDIKKIQFFMNPRKDGSGELLDNIKPIEIDFN